jgi:hypothetical protein
MKQIVTKQEIIDSVELVSWPEEKHDEPAGVHRKPSALFRDAIQRALGWASEDELLNLVFRYTGHRMPLGDSNRFSQEVAEIVIKGLIGSVLPEEIKGHE